MPSTYGRQGWCCLRCSMAPRSPDHCCTNVALRRSKARDEGAHACVTFWGARSACCNHVQVALAARKGPAAAAAPASQEAVLAPAVGVCVIEEEDVLGTSAAEPSCGVGGLPDAGGSGAPEAADAPAGGEPDQADEDVADDVAEEPEEAQVAAGTTLPPRLAPCHSAVEAVPLAYHKACPCF